MVAGISAEAAWAGGAVVIASLIAFIGVRLQTSKTLRAEQERLGTQLKAEKDRLALQLGHDRGTREREELRTVLDAAALAMDNLAFMAIEAMTAVEESLNQETPTDLEDEKSSKEPNSGNDRLDEKLDLLFAQIRVVDGHKSQIAMRLGPEHPLEKAYKEARVHFGAINQMLINLEVNNEGLSELLAQAGAKKKEFEQAAFGLIASELH